jgi:hypothetical protein
MLSALLAECHGAPDTSAATATARPLLGQGSGRYRHHCTDAFGKIKEALLLLLPLLPLLPLPPLLLLLLLE